MEKRQERGKRNSLRSAVSRQLWEAKVRTSGLNWPWT